MKFPLVSCIMPTANRPEFLTFAIDNFLNQDYPNCELVIVDDGIESFDNLVSDIPTLHYFHFPSLGTIGNKRNVACEKSNGEIIIHWDDDDWHAKDWISRHVQVLQSSEADISGLKKVLFYSYALNQNYVFQSNEEDEYWLCGGTMAFRKSLWDKYKFRNMQVGEDTDFITNSGGKIVNLDYLNGFYASIHDKNTSIKHLNKPNWDIYLSK